MEEQKPGDYCDKEKCYEFKPCPFHQPPKTRLDYDDEPEPAFDLFGDERPLGTASVVYSSKSATGFVGLFNMGATCYLNSLLQSLFLTREFRDVLFGWKYLSQKNGSTEFCIPYQLQLLFARLALSSRNAVDTKDLTHSFRWSTAESFRQHDIQELMRVLFEALEKTVGPRINELFQGSVIDYLTCQRCGVERQRKDTFLDLSLDISQSSTLEHALKQYVTPEMLTGDNQYRCEKCAQKVDAAKGLRFASLPRVLSIHLKRFVYDMARNTRVKENKSVTFPLSINMKTYFQVPSSSSAASSSETSSLDSNSSTVCSDNTSSASDTPDMWYDLNAVMLHSGTPVGGHYFTYIKCDNPPFKPNKPSSSSVSTTDDSLSSTQSSSDTSSSSSSASSSGWLEFNDSVVVPLGGDDPLRAAYGGTSSLSAYMLFYQQRQLQTSEAPVPVPEEVRGVIEAEDAKHAEEQKALEIERRTLDLAVVYQNHTHNYRFDQDQTLGVVQEAIRASLVPSLPASQARLREFAVGAAWAQQPLEGKDALTLAQCGFRKMNHLILETREADEQFPVYDPEEIPVRIVAATPENRQAIVDEALYPTARGIAQYWTINIKGKVGDAQVKLAPLLGVGPTEINVVRLSHNKAELLDPKYSLDYYDVKPGSVLFIELKMSPSELKEFLEEQEVTREGEAVADVEPSVADQINESPLESSTPATAATTTPASFSSSSKSKPLSLLIQQFEFARCQVSLGFNLPSTDLVPAYDQVLRVSKLQSLRVLKNLISSVIHVPVDDFRLRRSANGAQMKDLAATLESYQLIDGSVVHVELGPALKKNEYLLSLFLYDATKPDKKQFLFLWEQPVDASLKVSALKDFLLSLLNQRYESKEESGNTFGIKFLRLRQKNRLDVGKIFEDTKSLKAQFPGLDDGKPIALQGIPMAESMSSLYRPIFLQHYDSVAQTVGSKIEVLIKREAKVIDLKTMLLDISKIPRIENLGMAKGPTLQPLSVKQAATLVYDDPKLLNDGLLKMEPWHLRDNFVVVYTDLSLLPVQSTPEQKTNVKSRPKFGSVQYVPPKARPEVAMKIYVEENEAAFASDLKSALAASAAESSQPPSDVDGQSKHDEKL